ncbi:MAG: hypothetical protein KC933_24330 [Myxococcales bacterium]|nr:hypothetical protein [Myxococcales bacterium]MCB9651171.1 hypothetical protein [Deltaproteobacteria bacterium]
MKQPLIPALFVCALTACAAPTRIPYDHASVPTRAAPAHPLRVAILPLEDARQAREAPDDDGLYLYNGVSYRGTDLAGLEGDPMARVTEVLARHLAQARVFAQVILVLSREQAPEADLFLTGKVRRLRGYVEAESPPEQSARPPTERRVLSEVVLEDVELSPQDPAAPPRIRLDAGWSVLDTRAVDAEGEPPDPWAVASEALRVALDSLTEELAAADLSGRYEVKERVSLTLSPVSTASTSAPTSPPFGRLTEAPPAGWRLVRTSTGARPEGWRGEARCAQAVLQAQQSLRFSRSLGPYRPEVAVWACPEDLPLSFDARADFPARLLGRARGRWYLSRAVGKTNWPDAEAEIAAYLGLEPPPRRHMFQLGAGAP